jgi:hypothetical protein
MTQTLTKKDSTGKIQRAVRRHLRLTRRTGSEKALAVAQRIAEPAEQLKAAADTAQALRNAAEDAFDDWTQDDARLDRAVTLAYRRAQDYDVEFPGLASHGLLFGNKSASYVTRSPRSKEPDLVAKIVARGAALPADHPVLPTLPALAERAEASRAAHRAWTDALQRVAEADAVVDVARLAVIRAYRDNVIDIGRAIGESLATDCFPKLRKPRGPAGGDDAAVAEAIAVADAADDDEA